MGCLEAEGKNQFVRSGVRSNKKLGRIHHAFDHSDELLENIQPMEKMIDDETFQLLTSTLRKHFFFFNLSPYQLEEVLNQMFYCEVKKGKYIFKKGDEASCYMVVESGQVIIEEYKKVCAKGDSFGELALIYNAPRSASVKCVKDVGLWCLSRTNFKKSMTQMIEKNYQLARPHIYKVEVLQFLNRREKDAIAHSMMLMKFQPGQYIFKQNEEANNFDIMVEGKISLVVDDKEIRRIQVDQSFGEQGLIKHAKRMTSAIAINKVKILSIVYEDIHRILGSQLIKVVRYNQNKWAIRNSLLCELTSQQIDRMVNMIHTSIFDKGELIFSQGEECSKLVFVMDCQLVNKDKQVEVKKGALYGDTFLLGRESTVKQSLEMENKGLIGIIPFANIRKCFPNLEKVLEQNKEIKTMKLISQQKQASNLQLKLETTIVLKKLGHGQFGTVLLIKDNDRLFALKCIKKKQVIDHKLQKLVIQQKKILSIVDHPFIMKFYGSCKNQYFIYFITEYINGQELFQAIRQIGILETKLAQFYTAILILAIEYFHQKKIIYRDLKPENVMLQCSGYLKLIDLGTAKRLKDDRGFRTFTLIGTPQYMGPQTFQGKGYTFSSDLWSIGVMLYQFINGELPYGQFLQDPADIYKEIIKKSLHFSQKIDKHAVSLITQLLNKAPENRLGRSYAALKNHPFFQGLNWQSLYNQKIKPFYISEQCKKQTKILNLTQGHPFQYEIKKQTQGLQKNIDEKLDGLF